MAAVQVASQGGTDPLAVLAWPLDVAFWLLEGRMSLVSRQRSQAPASGSGTPGVQEVDLGNGRRRITYSGPAGAEALRAMIRGGG